MTGEIRVRRRAPNTLIAWQWNGQPREEWPEWIVSRVGVVAVGIPFLVYERRSGRQWLRPGEWLICDLDGGIKWMPDDVFRAKYEEV